MVMDQAWTWMALVAIAGLFWITRIFYRLYFHPLAKIPGPKLAAASHLLEFYYDVILGGKFLFQVEKMHQKYGPIVRINPKEVHIIDPTFYNEIYASGMRKRDKYEGFVRSLAADESTVSTVGSEKHRFRRSILQNFFSKRSVMEFSSAIGERVEKLMRRLEVFEKTQTPVALDVVFSALTSDMITYICYGKDWKFLDHKDFNCDIHQAGVDFANFFHFNRFFPWVFMTLRALSPRMLALLIPGRAATFKFQESLLKHAIEMAANEQSDAPSKETEKSRPNVISNLINPSIPYMERSRRRLEDEVITILVAGTEAPVKVLSMAMYYLGSEPAIGEKLRAELKTILPARTSTATYAELEKLPYLHGVVYESLRISDSVIARFPRIAPTETLRYKDHILPPGTPMSCSSYFISRNHDLFPNPEKFDPERWIHAAEKAVSYVSIPPPFHLNVLVGIGNVTLLLNVVSPPRELQSNIMDSLETLRSDLEWSLPQLSNDKEPAGLGTEGLGQSPSQLDVHRRLAASNDQPAGRQGEIETWLSDKQSPLDDLHSELSLGYLVTESYGNDLILLKKTLEPQAKVMSVDSGDSEATTIRVSSVSDVSHQDHEVSSIVTLSRCQPNLSSETCCETIPTTETASETNLAKREQATTSYPYRAQG
ncbi:cytochrome P450 [Aspergillus oryzae]|uniref:Cytochrome P450 n=3 Tax=Aspergillus oryzae TaxID=5062 RepID=A0A1S9D8A8_ASPOZ|nr:cytochrome P450 [Aspergillus oryzae]